ncbi:MAG: hypothetical protein WKG07_08920 [Hymenobacter sp.]
MDSAKWFIDAIRQRQNTLLRTMNAIVGLQRDFFHRGRPKPSCGPMILKGTSPSRSAWTSAP